MLADERLECLGVLAKDGKRRMVRRAALRVPLATVDIDEPSRALYIDDEDAVRPEECDVDFVQLETLLQLEVVDDSEAVREVVAHVGDRLPLGIVRRLADRDHPGHRAPPSMAPAWLWVGDGKHFDQARMRIL